MNNSNFKEHMNIKFYNFYKGIISLFQNEKIVSNVILVVYRIIRFYRIKVTFNSINEELKSHPNYPSLKSICDFFDDKKIVNHPLRLKESDLYKLKDPFIAHVEISEGKILLVYSINEEQVVYADELFWKKKISTHLFLEKWDGVVIVINPTKFSGEANYNERKANDLVRNLLPPSVILLFLLYVTFGILFNVSFFKSSLRTTSFVIPFTHLAGLFFSMLLLRRELNFKTNFTDRLCNIATNADCDAVIQSKASKIFANITWADFGVTYFSGGLLTLFILPITNSLNTIALFAMTTLPYPLFSLFYQWKIIGKWCPFCLSVQIILIAEFLILYKVLSLSELQVIGLFEVSLIFSTLFLFILTLKSLLLSEKGNDHLKVELLRLRREPETFIYKLETGAKIDIPFNKSAIIYGNYHLDVFVSVFLSLNCVVCAKRFTEIKKMVENDNKINFQLIFFPPKDELSVKLLITFFSLYNSDHRIESLELIQKWYSTNEKEKIKLLKEANTKSLPKSFKEMIIYNSTLFLKGRVTKVPAAFVNGYPLPNTYRLEDLKYHIMNVKAKKKCTDASINQY